MLAELNKHPRDICISFIEEGHIYNLKTSDIQPLKNPISVTTLIHSYFKPFIPDNVIKSMMNSPNWEKSEYYGMAPEEIKNQWTESARLGTLMHESIEHFLDGKDIHNDTKEFKLFKDFWSAFSQKYPQYKPYRLEWCVYDEDFRNGLGLCGSIDAVLQDNNNNLVLLDWKRTKKISEVNEYDTGYPPFDDMDDCNLSHYTLQLNIYRHILEIKYNKNVIFMMLVILHPKQNIPRCIPVKKIDLTPLWDNL